MSGPVRVFLTNSGTEAVEGALKLARYATGRPYVISFFGAFHGRTYGAVTLTASKAKYHQGFGPLLPGVLHAPYACNQIDPDSGARSHDPEETFDYLENVLFRYEVPASEVAAIFVEPVQGEGGYIVPPAEWLVRLRDAVHQARHPARGRRGPVGDGPHRPDVGHRARGRGARHPDQREGARIRVAARRLHGPGRPDGILDRRRARLDVRRQPGSVRGRHRDAGGHQLIRAAGQRDRAG